MKDKNRTEVLVVGAGPVGLFAAVSLAMRGIDVRIVDKFQRSALHSYALALHPDSLRLLDAAGLARELIDHGRIVRSVGLYRETEHVHDLALGELDGPFPFALVLPQTVLESALEQRLDDLGVRVQWGHQVLSIDRRSDGVQALVAKLDAAALDEPADDVERAPVRTAKVDARFLVGADGARSIVREFLRMPLIDCGPVETFRLLEFESDAELPDDARVVFHGAGTNVLWGITSRRGRWSLQVLDGDDPSTGPDAARGLVRARAPWFTAPVQEVYWDTTVTFTRCVAESFGVERIWLAGDAAHMTGPIGVHSMNVSFREVDDLARRVTDLLQNDGPSDLLEGYATERRDEWSCLLGRSEAPRALDSAPSWVRGLEPRVAACLPASGPQLSSLLAQIGLTQRN